MLSVNERPKYWWGKSLKRNTAKLAKSSKEGKIRLDNTTKKSIILDKFKDCSLTTQYGARGTGIRFQRPCPLWVKKAMEYQSLLAKDWR